MSPAERWLRERLGCAPPRLLETMVAALPAEAADVPEALGEGALALYRTVLRGSSGREDALPLLAADALLTHAFEAQVELDPGQIAELARRWGGAGRLGEVGEGVASQALTPRPPLPQAGEGGPSEARARRG